MQLITKYVQLRLPGNGRAINLFFVSECAVYGDCCIDAPVFNPVEQKLHTDKFTCLELTQYGHVYVRSRCPQEWRDKAMNKKCLHNDEVLFFP